MTHVNIDNTLEVQAVGVKALNDALGPVGAARFMRQCNFGYDDYTKDHQEEPDISEEEIMSMLRDFRNEIGVA
ncbi:MAG: hypothetical protein LUG49_02765 [Oscillospiraceae bacterium]|nr:hypothetical protein [Oscillospiraceae bacterium]